MATSSTYNKYSCFCFTRKFKIAEIQPPDDVRLVFETYADGVGNGGGPTISAQGLRRFLVESQREKKGISSPEVAKMVEKFRGVDTPNTAAKHYLGKIVKHGASNFLSIEEFYQFLFSPDFNSPIKHEVHQDMTLPISHYYVFTGHNSYLTGNQLSSECSDIPIIKALQKGVRVIELDMWPNSTRDNVVILHGRTLTAPVEIIKCLKSIKQYAFDASPYPLVITLEDHLTPDLQAKVAEMIKETFGDMLYIPGDEPMKEFPSPDDLKHKIIISTKPPKEYLEAKDNKRSGSQQGSNGNAVTERTSDAVVEEAGGKDVSDLKSEASYDKDEDESEEEEEYPKFGKDTANQYRDLITIQAGKSKGSLKDSLQIDPTRVRRLSLGEQKLIKACTSHSADVIRFTQSNLLRVYPKGTRVTSTNYEPMLAWIHGAQMVAFNTQGHGKELRMMQGFFKANGSCGYVRKPDFLMKVGPNGEVFDPSVPLPVKQTLKVKIYMGDGWRMDFSKTHFDAYSPPDFYAKMGIEGVPADILSKKTKVIEDNWVPIWDEEFSFPLTVPELAVLRIEVKDYNVSEKHDFGGQTCLPVSELRPGIRAVPLYDKNGSVYKSVRILMRFKFV